MALWLLRLSLSLTSHEAPRTLAPDLGCEESLYQSDMMLIGLTGNIGSGKSTVARLMSEHGATVVDADVLARRAVELGTPAYDKIVARWGSAVLAPDNHLDGGALRQLVFSDSQQLEALNRI